MILSHHHAQITVAPGQADKVRWFYGQVLGLPEIPVPDNMSKYGLIWFKVGSTELHVGIEPHADRLGTFAHLAYQVDDLNALRSDLSALGLLIIEQPVITGYDRFHTRDPFGNRVEFIQKIQ